MKPKMTKNFLLAGIALAASLVAESALAVTTIVDFQHNSGSLTPDFTNTNYITSAVAATNLTEHATSIDQLSGAPPIDDSMPYDFDLYFSYSIVNDSDTVVEYTSVAIDTAAKVTSRVYQVSYIVDGAETFLTGDWTNASLNTDVDRLAVDYDLTGLTTSSDLEFRVYWAGTARSTSLQRVYVDEFTLSAVPELSSSFMAMGLAVTGLMSRRRSKR